MSGGLGAFVAAELQVDVPSAVRAFAQSLAKERDAAAVLYYGSNLRTGDLGGVLDFYVLTRRPHRSGARAWVEQRLWPEISFRQWPIENGALAAKVATMPLGTFGRAARGELTDTTIWARFVQPCALAWSAGPEEKAAIVNAICDAAVTAARHAAVLGPAEGAPAHYWQALFAETYRAEFRVERPGREGHILAGRDDRYARLLPLAWETGGIAFTETGAQLAPQLDEAGRSKLLASWRQRRRWGRPLNLSRLAKAAVTTDGAIRYAAWKLERHNRFALTPWQRRHPLLASPAILWRWWRSRRQADAA